MNTLHSTEGMLLMYVYDRKSILSKHGEERVSTGLDYIGAEGECPADSILRPKNLSGRTLKF